MYIKSVKNKEITKEQIQKDEGLHSKICKELQTMQIQSQKSVQDKQQYLREQDEELKILYDDNRIKYDMIYSYKKTFISMFQDEGLSPVFTERDFFDKEMCKKINGIANYDIELINKEQKDQKLLSDIFDYGVGIRVLSGRDNNKNVPTYFSPSPLSWYPDPNGNIFDDNFDYHLFARQTSTSELEYLDLIEGGFFGLDDVLTGTTEINNNTQDSKNQRLIKNADSTDGSLVVYLCFITINGHRYSCVVANSLTKIIRRSKLEAMTNFEKKENELVPFPISLSYTTPNVYDMFGESYREKIKPIQVALTELVNAIHSKQMRDAGHNIVLYDIDRISNANDLLMRPVGGPLFIPVSGLGEGPITSSVVESNDTSKTENYISNLKMYVDDTTSLTGVLRGLPPDTDTLGETKIQMQQSGILFSVDAKNLMIGERMFWGNIWYRSLKANIQKAKEKVVVLGNSSTMIRIVNSDFVGGKDPYLKIISKKDTVENAKLKINSMLSILPLIQQDPNVHPISVKIFKRELMTLQGLDEAFIYCVEPLDSSERHSMMIVDLINNKIEPKNLIVQGIDIQTLWIYVNGALDNDVKEKILFVLNMKMIQEGIDKPKFEGGDVSGIANSMGSQMISNQISDGRQQVQ